MDLRPTVGLLSALLPACVSAEGLHADSAKHVARWNINEAKVGCMAPGATLACDDLGRMLMHVEARSLSRWWSEKRDPASAALAFRRGCQNDDGPSCRDLVELDLAADAAERQWATRRAAELRAPVRPPEASALALAKEYARAAKADADVDKFNAEVQAQIDAENRAGWSQVGAAALGQVSASVSASSDLKKDVGVLGSKKADALQKVAAGVDAVNKVSEAASGRPAIGPGGTLLDVCVPCADEGKTLAAACKSAASKGCQDAIDSMSKCLGRNECAQ